MAVESCICQTFINLVGIRLPKRVKSEALRWQRKGAGSEATPLSKIRTRRPAWFGGQRGLSGAGRIARAS